MSDKYMNESFKDWWAGDPDDEPITGVTKKKAKEIFNAGYFFGSKRPVYQMSQSQYELFFKMIEQKIRKEHDISK